MTATGLYTELAVIREAAELLAERFSMIGDLLRQASATFQSALQSGAVQECPDGVKDQIASLATEVRQAGGSHNYAEKVESFEANAVIGRILDLGQEIGES